MITIRKRNTMQVATENFSKKVYNSEGKEVLAVDFNFITESSFSLIKIIRIYFKNLLTNHSKDVIIDL